MHLHLPTHAFVGLQQVANRVVAVEDKKLAVYEGDYKCVRKLALPSPGLTHIALPCLS